MTEAATAVYLGDSVYVEVQSGMLKLTTNNGYGATNTIFLDAEVINNLNRYVQSRICINAVGDIEPFAT